MDFKTNRTELPCAERQPAHRERPARRNIHSRYRWLLTESSSKISAILRDVIGMIVMTPVIVFAVFRSRLCRHESTYHCSAIEKEKLAKDLTKMIELAERLSTDHCDYAEAMERRREKVYHLYKEAVARESHLVTQVRRNPEDLDVKQNLEDERWKANALYREYMALR